MEELSWKELLRVVDSARSSSQKCTIRVLDTVFVDREDANDISWYFTTKNGTISKKKKDKCTLAGICERFSRFSLANPHNVEGIVCSVIGADGGRRYLTQTEMNTFVNARDLTIPAGSFLQVYLRPIGGSAHVVRATCIVEPTGRKAITVTSENIIGPMGVWGHEPKELAVEAKDQAKYFCHELSNFFSNESTGYTVTEFEIECVLDDNKHLWLSSVPHCSVSSIAETTGAPALPGLIKQNRSIGGSAPGSPRANSSEGRGVVSTAPGSLPASKLVSRIEGGAVHCCARGPEDLPGLRAWIAVAMHQDQGRSGDKTKLRWFVDVTAYNGGTSPNPHKVSIFEQRAVMRKSVPHSMLSLLKLAEPILLGSEHIDTEIDFISRWKFIFGAWVASQRVVSQVSGETDALSEGDIERILQHSNHVTVDGNCHAICQKLESLVEAEFSVSSPSPMATTGGSRGTSAGFSDRATKTDSDAVKASNCITEVTMDRRQILSAGNDGGYPVAAPPLQPYAAQWDNDNVSIVSSIGDASVVKAATRNKLLEHNPPKYKVHREDSPESAIRGAKKPNVNSLKVKKKKPIIKQPPAEKMVTPDMELLGKFAAEKDKQHRLLIQAEAASDIIEPAPSSHTPFVATRSRDASPPRMDPVGSDAMYLKNQKRRMEFQHQPNAVKSQLKKGGQKAKREDDHLYNDYYGDNGYSPQPLGQEGYVASFSSAIAPSPQWSNYEGRMNDNASLTGSEANFMMRHAESGDFSHVQSDSYEDGDLSRAPTKTVDATALNNKISLAMRQRVEMLQTQVANLTSRLEKKDVELQRLEEKQKKLNNEKISLMNANNKELSRIQEEHERELLNLKTEHAFDLSNLVNDPKALEIAAGHSSPHGAGIPRQESTIQATSALIQQIDDMRADLKAQADRFAVERRQYTADHSLRMITAEKSFKIELQEQKTLTAALEDRLKDTEDALAEVRSKEKTSRMLCAQLESKYKESVEVQTKLKNDLKIMQASVGTTYKLESAQDIGVGVDADTAIRLAEAKSEAKIRQIQIKCDFMRSQLEAEHVAQEQLQVTIENQKKDYEQLKQDFRTRVREMETEKQQAVEDQERQTELHFEERMLELSALQAKFHMLQGQLQEAFQDNSLSKQREEAAKANTLKAQAQQANLRAELNNVKSIVEELRAQKEEGSAKDSANQSNEAMLRRLDNERTYLKSQLSSEMTHKNELQNALRQCQQQLADQQRQWTTDVDTLKANLTRQEEESTLLEQKLSLRISSLEGEDARLKAQNAELRDGFKKMRDQLRMEELNTENTRTANRRLLEEVESNRAELARQRAAEEATNMFSQQQAYLMSGSLSALEEKAAAEAAHLRAELSKQYVINATGQRALLDMKSDLEIERIKLDKKLLAGRMVHSLRHMYKNRIAAVFRHWFTKSTLIDAAGQFKENLRKALVRSQEESRQDAETALEQLRRQVTVEWTDRLANNDRDHEDRLRNAIAEADAQRELSLEDLREEMEEVLRAREAEWISRHEDTEGWTRSLLKEEAEKKEELVKEYEKRAVEEARRRDEQEADHVASAKAFVLAEAEKNWREMQDRRDIEYQVHLEHSLHAVEEAHLIKIKALKLQLADAQTAALAEQAEKFKREIDVLEQKHAEDEIVRQGVHMDEIHDLMGSAQVKHEDEMADLKSEMEHSHEKRIRELREIWNEELQAKMEDHDARMTLQFNEKAEKLDNSLEAERKKAEALEAAKWRQALKDAEKRYKLDLQQVRAQAWSERDEQSKLEAQALTADSRRALQSVKDKHAEIVDELKMAHSNEIEKLKNGFEADVAEAVRLSVLNTTTELNDRWTNEFNTKLVAAEKNAQQQWALKYNKEKELTEKLRGDMAKQMQLQAEERNILQEKINGNDEIQNRLKEDHKYEMQRIERDHERSLDNLDIRFQNAKKIWMDEEKKRADEDMANQKAAWEVETKLRVLKVKTDMESEMEAEMQKVKEESDQLVTGLEEAMSNVRVEKTALVEDLERASERLEELEDAQFDLQQELKLKAKEMSFAIWRISTGAMNMKITFRQVMEDTQIKTTELLDSTKINLMRRVEKVTLLSMRLSELLSVSEASRLSMHEALTKYKSNILVERRAQIRMTEMELDRLGTDREVMEEERGNLLDQIGGKGGLESQVEEVEEQMREHTNSSTVMQNGRINVAHAKKKKRLDNELERLLELIEEKKSQVSSLEQRADAVQSRREEKEVVLIDLEKELVQILIDQQRLVLNLVEDAKLTGDRSKHLSLQYNFPWPPVENPSMENAKDLAAAIGDS